jgi:acylglycerol lipase
VSGLVILCPLIYTAPQSRPHWSVEAAAKFIRWLPFGGHIPLAKAHRGNSAADPAHFEEFLADPLT